MSLSFLVPAFLIGLAALAIPVIIHLTRKQTKDSVEFPSLMFVSRVEYRSTRRRQIRNWPLLLMRCAAIALIALAFARPFVQSEEADAAPLTRGSREVVVLLDRSYSMGYGERWEQAKAEALSRLSALGPADRGTVVLFDTRAEVMVESSPDQARLRAAVEGAVPSARATRYAPALRYAERLLASSPHPRREVVVISDLQANAWRRDEGEMSSIAFPAGTVVTPVAIGEAESANVVVGSVNFARTLAAGRERAVATANLVNQGAARTALPVTLEIDGRRVETRNVDLPAGGAATVEFAPVTLAQQGLTRGVVRIPDDALPVDNAFNFALSPDQRLSVVVVDGGGGGGYFLERALSIGDQPGFATVVRPQGGLRAVDLANAAVVILNQAPMPGGEVGNRLRAFVENGGGLLFLMGTNSTGAWEGVLPDRVGRVTDHTAVGGTALGYIDFGHPTFEPFATAGSGDLTAARFYRYRSLPEIPNQRILARFGDGAPALTEQPAGKGRVMVWASTPDGEWNDLAVQPVFLPLVHQMVKHASGYAPSRPALTVGDPFDPATARAAAGDYAMAVSPADERIELEVGRPLILDEPGFYELRDPRSGQEATAIAVNVDPEESSLEAIVPATLASALTPSADAARTAGGTTLTLAEREREQSAWWYLVVVGFVLLAAETVISNLRRTRATAV